MNRKAFTMIELLTVIAIIAILAAIIFPVGARARAAGFRSADMSNLNEIRHSIQLYKVDQEAYPPQLLGYASLYYGGANDGQVVPANLARGFVAPKPMTVEELRPNQNRVANTLITTAVWPNQDDRATGSAPLLDLNGDGKIDGTDDVAGARQEFGPTQVVRRQISDADVARQHTGGREEVINTATYPNSTSNSGGLTDMNTYFYNISGYDVAAVKVAGGGTRTELRYAPFWSNFGLGAGDKTDDPRQLGYDDPPENTVVTWNSFWREYDSAGMPLHQKQDMVLFLGGGAKAVDSYDMNRFSWRYMP